MPRYLTGFQWPHLGKDVYCGLYVILIPVLGNVSIRRNYIRNQ